MIDPLTVQLLDHLHRGGRYGYWWTMEGRQSFWWEVGARTSLPGGRRNIYFGVHPTGAIPPTNMHGEPKPPAEVRAQLGSIVAINALFTEFDAKDFDGKKEDAYAAVCALDPPPSAVVDSGGGYHCYWLLESVFSLASADDRERARQIQAAWVRLTGGDPQSKDLARVLRVPGTYNHKYDPPRRVTIDSFDPVRRYAFADLAALAAPFVESERPATNGAVPHGDHSGWLLKALAGEIAKVASVRDGFKHERVLDSAIALGGLVHLGLDERAIEDGLYGAIQDRAKDQKGARKTILDGIAYGKARPRDIPSPSARNGRTPTAEPPPEAWGAPLPFHNLDLPGFPTDIFPDWLRDYVDALTLHMQTPPDLAGMLALSVLAACCHGRAMVEAWAGWREPLNIYTVTSLAPGSRKSPIFRAMTAPLVAYEQDQGRRAAAQIASRSAEKDVIEQRLEQAKRDAAKAKGESERESAMESVGQLANELQFFAIPASPRMIVDDITPETLASVLAEQGGRIAALSSEGDIFAIMAGRYSSGAPNIGVYLRAHAGDPLRVDRRNRSEYVRAPALTIGVTTQPDVLASFGQTAAFRGQGLLGRFFYALPRSTVGARAIVTPPVPAAVACDYHETIGALIDMLRELDESYSVNCVNSVETPNDYGDSVKNNNNSDSDHYIYILTLSTEAQQAFIAWLEWLEPLMGDTGALAAMRDWGSKLGGAVLRVAGLLHLADAARHNRHNRHNCVISAATLADALRLADYLLPHAQAAYAEIGSDPAVAQARRILRWIDEARAPEFTKRDAFRALSGSFKRAADMDPALELLSDHQYIRPLDGDERPGPGRKPSQRYAVNPALARGHTPGAGMGLPPRPPVIPADSEIDYDNVRLLLGRGQEATVREQCAAYGLSADAVIAAAQGVS